MRKDIEVACNVAQWKVEDPNDPNLDVVKTLLNDYGDGTENLFSAMVELLGQRDLSSLESKWEDCWSGGKGLLGALDEHAPEPQRLSGFGLDNFRAGEGRRWEKNDAVEIALAASEIQRIYDSNLNSAQECSEEIKTVLNSKEEVQKLIEGRYGAASDVLVKMLVFLNGFRKIATFGRQIPLDTVTGLGDELLKNSLEIKEAAEKKRALETILSTRSKIIIQTRDSFDEKAIDRAYGAGVAAVNSLKSLDKGSPYEAEDWEEFGENCRKKLEERQDQAKESSNQLFELLYNILIEAMEKSFETLSDDPAQLDRWNDEILAAFDSIDKLLDDETGDDDDTGDADTSENGPKRQAAAAAWMQVKVWMKLWRDGWSSNVEEAEEIVKQR
ncbi:MAG: hypothetical protein WA869_31595 [Alloacidobacterium sp.]|jgi:hypothetical protein